MSKNSIRQIRGAICQIGRGIRQLACPAFVCLIYYCVNQKNLT